MGIINDSIYQKIYRITLSKYITSLGKINKKNYFKKEKCKPNPSELVLCLE